MIVKMTNNPPSTDGFYIWQRNEFEKPEMGFVKAEHFSGKTIAGGIKNIIRDYPNSTWSDKLDFEYVIYKSFYE